RVRGAQAPRRPRDPPGRPEAPHREPLRPRARQETGMGKHVIVGAGQVGARLAVRLAGLGHDVVVVTRSGSGPEGVERVAADAADRARLTRIARGADALYNCANPPYHRWPRDWPGGWPGSGTTASSWRRGAPAPRGSSGSRRTPPTGPGSPGSPGAPTPFTTARTRRTTAGRGTGRRWPRPSSARRRTPARP